MPASRRTFPRFRIGQKIRVIKKCSYYPEHPAIPAEFKLNRWAHVRQILGPGRMFAVEIPGYPNLIDYSTRELRSR